MTTAIYPATFDPITNGHIDIATRAARIFSKVVVAVFDRPTKNLLFSTAERLAMVQNSLGHLPNVEVVSYTGLTVQFAKESQAQVIVRGLRVVSDFEWEFQLSLTNNSLDPDIETVCLMTRQEFSFLSSSILKDIALNGGDIRHLAPAMVVEAMKNKRREQEARSK